MLCWRDVSLTRESILLSHLHSNDIDNIIVRRRHPPTSHQPQVNKIDTDDECCADERALLHKYWKRPGVSTIAPISRQLLIYIYEKGAFPFYGLL